MAKLGTVDLGDSIRLEVTIKNLSEELQNVDAIAIAIEDYDGNVRLNTTTSGITNSTTGTYYYDAYLDASVYSPGIHRVIWSGSIKLGTKNFSFVQEDTFYIKD